MTAIKQSASLWFFIWSHEHQAWWRPGRNGYTTDIEKAGVYDPFQARQIVTDANMFCEKGEISECAIPAHCIAYSSKQQKEN